MLNIYANLSASTFNWRHSKTCKKFIAELIKLCNEIFELKLLLAIN